MRRNQDLIRDLLFKFEEDEEWLQLMPGGRSGSTEQEEITRAHILLMMDDGFAEFVGRDTFRLTSTGYDYLEAIRSDTVWQKTKDGAAQVGGMTISMMKDLAVAYVKQEAAAKLGISL